MLGLPKKSELERKSTRSDRLCALTIPPHVHVCVTGDGSVLLDLKRDKYFGLSKEDTELAANVIGTWPKLPWHCNLARPMLPAAALQAEELCRSLAAVGLLAPETDGWIRPAEESSHDMRREWISVGDEVEIESPVTQRHVANFAAAFVWARYSLAWRPFWVTVEATRRMKARGGSNVNHVQVLEVAALVGVFRRLRPFVFAAEGRCLLHALTLIRFLSRYDVYPDWVIGVATQPWAAHSWVQWGDFLLDSNPNKVCRYTPIMVV